VHCASRALTRRERANNVTKRNYFGKYKATARQVEAVMKAVYDKIGLEYNTYVTTINKKGVEVVGM